MTPIEIITLIVGILLLIDLYLYKKDLKDDFEFFCLTGKHLYDPQNLKEREKLLFWVAVCNLVLSLFNSLYLFFK